MAVYVEYKVSVWRSALIPDADFIGVQDIIRDIAQGDMSILDDDEVEIDFLWDTIRETSLADNEGRSTIKVKRDDILIYENGR